MLLCSFVAIEVETGARSVFLFERRRKTIMHRCCSREEAELERFYRILSSWMSLLKSKSSDLSFQSIGYHIVQTKYSAHGNDQKWNEVAPVSN